MKRIPKITKEEFIALYTECLTQEQKRVLLDREVAVPCACGHQECQGWMMCGKGELQTKAYIDLYKPEDVDVFI